MKKMLCIILYIFFLLPIFSQQSIPETKVETVKYCYFTLPDDLETEAQILEFLRQDMKTILDKSNPLKGNDVPLNQRILLIIVLPKEVQGYVYAYLGYTDLNGQHKWKMTDIYDVKNPVRVLRLCFKWESLGKFMWLFVSQETGKPIAQIPMNGVKNITNL